MTTECACDRCASVDVKAARGEDSPSASALILALRRENEALRISRDALKEGHRLMIEEWADLLAERDELREQAERDGLESRLVGGMLVLLHRHCACFAPERHPSLEIQVSTVVRAVLGREKR